MLSEESDEKTRGLRGFRTHGCWIGGIVRGEPGSNWQRDLDGTHDFPTPLSPMRTTWLVSSVERPVSSSFGVFPP